MWPWTQSYWIWACELALTRLHVQSPSCPLGSHFLVDSECNMPSWGVLLNSWQHVSGLELLVGRGEGLWQGSVHPLGSGVASVTHSTVACLLDSGPHPTPTPALCFGGASVERVFCRAHLREPRLGCTADRRQTDRSTLKRKACCSPPFWL